jgi:hypothetical protein
MPGAKSQGRRTQRPRATLNYYRTTVGPKRHQGHQRARGRTKRDTRGTGGHKGESEWAARPEAEGPSN